MKQRRKQFMKKILPVLGNVRRVDDYYGAFCKLYDNQNKELKTTELLKNETKARNVAKRFVTKKIVKERKPKTTYLNDKLNDVVKFGDIDEFIEEYKEKLLQHAYDDEDVLGIISEVLGETKEEAIEWIKRIGDSSNFEQYNKIIDKLVEGGFDLELRQYGYMEWGRMNNKYELKDKYKNTFEEEND